MRRSPASCTAMTATQIRPASRLDDLVAGIRTAVERHAGWAETARLVADQLRHHLPTPDVLTAAQRLGSPDDYQAYPLHVEPDGSFSIIALVWRPGQLTRIHDHVTWCVFGVIQGVEHEELFDADLRLIGRSANHVGDVSGFAPPGDIHPVHNTADETAISIHVYGTDVTRIGSTNGCSPPVGGRPAVVAASTTSSSSGTIRGSAPRSWGPESSATPDGTRTRTGRARGVPIRRSTHRSSSLPITRARRSRWRAARRSTSSTLRLPRPSRRPARPRAARTCASAGVRA